MAHIDYSARIEEVDYNFHGLINDYGYNSSLNYCRCVGLFYAFLRFNVLLLFIL